MGAPGIVSYILKETNILKGQNSLNILEESLKENDLQTVLQLTSRLKYIQYKEKPLHQGSALFKLGENNDNVNADDKDEHMQPENEEQKVKYEEALTKDRNEAQTNQKINQNREG